MADIADRASLEEAAYNGEALNRQQMRAKAMTFAPRDDGNCACGCGNPVHPKRLALGYGLTLECSERRERR